MVLDCHGCRASVPRFCATCVQQAITERRGRLREIEAEKDRLERSMRRGLQQRRRELEQREARRAHAATVSRLSSELASVRADANRHSVTVDEIRHSIRRHERQLPPAAVPAPVEPSVGEQRALNAQRLDEAARRLTQCRRSLLRQLLRLHQMQWLHSSQHGGDSDAADEGGDDVVSDMVLRGLLVNQLLQMSREAGLDSAAPPSSASMASMASMGSSAESSGGGGGPSAAGGAAQPEQEGATAQCSLLGQQPPGAGPSSEVDADAQSISLGHAVLMLQLASRYLALTPLPYKAVFQGSHSLIWHHGQHRALPLHAERCSTKEWRQAAAMLNANALYLLSHFPEAAPSPHAQPAAAAPTRGVLENVAALLDQPCLAWELKPGLAQLWQPPPEVEAEREADDWDVVERPAIPTPAQTGELNHWEKAHSPLG